MYVGFPSDSQLRAIIVQSLICTFTYLQQCKIDLVFKKFVFKIVVFKTIVSLTIVNDDPSLTIFNIIVNKSVFLKIVFSKLFLKIDRLKNGHKSFSETIVNHFLKVQNELVVFKNDRFWKRLKNETKNDLFQKTINNPRTCMPQQNIVLVEKLMDWKL